MWPIHIYIVQYTNCAHKHKWPFSLHTSSSKLIWPPIPSGVCIQLHMRNISQISFHRKLHYFDFPCDHKIMTHIVFKFTVPDLECIYFVVKMYTPSLLASLVMRCNYCPNDTVSANSMQSIDSQIESNPHIFVECIIYVHCKHKDRSTTSLIISPSQNVWF